MPRSYQVTPVILGGGGRHGKSRSDPKVDRRIESQPAAVRETNRRAGVVPLISRGVRIEVCRSETRSGGFGDSAASATMQRWPLEFG